MQSDAFALRIRPLIAAPLQEALGPRASFGRIKASLLPLYLEVRDVVIPAAGTYESVAIRRVRLYLNPFPLIYGSISLPSVAVLEPRVRVGRSTDGAFDLAELVATIRGNIERMQHPGKSTYSVHIRALTVRNGTVVIADAGSQANVTMSRLNMKIKLNLPSAAFGARLTSGDLLITAPAIRDIKGQVRGNVNIEQGHLAIDGFELTAEDTRISASGSVGIGTGGGLT